MCVASLDDNGDIAYSQLGQYDDASGGSGDPMDNLYLAIWMALDG
jgi:hypothetical protein